MDKTGSIEVICGSMFSGKTEELIRRIKRATIARQKIELFKPTVDVRYSETDVVSHDRKALSSTPVENSSSILLLAGDADVIGIDEAQFFDNGLVDVCNQLANQGRRVIVAGLDMDYLWPLPTMFIKRAPSVCVVVTWPIIPIGQYRATGRFSWARCMNTNRSAANATLK